jgi:hypothetical protein
MIIMIIIIIIIVVVVIIIIIIIIILPFMLYTLDAESVINRIVTMCHIRL